MDKAVILARGLGTRLRAGTPARAALTPGQAAVAAAGIKALMPVGGRPFLDYGLSRLAEAGYAHVCLVIGPEHVVVRRYYESTRLTRLSIGFAVQERARGTADAVAVAETFVAGESFLVVNADNLYPTEALRALRELEGPGLAVFERDSLIRESNIEPGRIARFAVADLDEAGYLTAIHEKPGAVRLDGRAGPIWVSMNAWRFDATIFADLAAVTPSERGELELPDAVRRAMAGGRRRFRAVRGEGGVLDLTGPGDVSALESRLAGARVEL